MGARSKTTVLELLSCTNRKSVKMLEGCFFGLVSSASWCIAGVALSLQKYMEFSSKLWAEVAGENHSIQITNPSHRRHPPVQCPPHCCGEAVFTFTRWEHAEMITSAPHVPLPLRPIQHLWHWFNAKKCQQVSLPWDTPWTCSRTLAWAPRGILSQVSKQESNKEQDHYAWVLSLADKVY